MINRKLLANGLNPSENRKMQKSVRTDQAANSFEVVTREWYAKYSTTWSANHDDHIIRRFERDIFPWVGGQTYNRNQCTHITECSTSD